MSSDSLTSAQGWGEGLQGDDTCRNLQSTVHIHKTALRPLAIPSKGICSSSLGEIPGRRTNWPDLDPLPRGSSQLWSKARSRGANWAARSQPSSLSPPKQSCPLQIGFLYLSKHMAEEGYIMDPKFCHVPYPRHTNQLELLSSNVSSLGKKTGWAQFKSLNLPRYHACGQEKGRSPVLTDDSHVGRGQFSENVDCYELVRYLTRWGLFLIQLHHIVAAKLRSLKTFSQRRGLLGCVPLKRQRNWGVFSF